MSDPLQPDDFGPSPASLWTLGAALREIERLKAIIKIAQPVCGQGNCNCVGSRKVREALQTV